MYPAIDNQKIRTLGAAPKWLMPFMVVLCALSGTLFVDAANGASAETRTLRMYYTHTKESITVTYKKNGRYVPSGLSKLNRFLRDFRRNEPTKMDPKLFDLVWEVYQKSGSKKPIHVISGYRSPRTNSMLRKRGRKVARNSQHVRGRALDFFLPDVSVDRLRALGLRHHVGGVGYYRNSFVHLDTGNVRHWPRMSRRQLAKVFPKGRTLHVPSDGRRMKGYTTAAANLKRGLYYDGSSKSSGPSKTLLASIFNGSDDRPSARTAAAKPKARAASVTAAPKPAARQPAKPSGPDPFALEVAAARKATARKQLEESENAPETTSDNVTLPVQVAIPRRRPQRSDDTQFAAVRDNAIRPSASVGEPTTVLAFAAPSNQPSFRPSNVLRPRVDIPGTSEITGNVQHDTDGLRSRVELAFQRQRDVASKQSADVERKNRELAEKIAKLQIPQEKDEAEPVSAGLKTTLPRSRDNLRVEQPARLAVPVPSNQSSVSPEPVIALRTNDGRRTVPKLRSTINENREIARPAAAPSRADVAVLLGQSLSVPAPAIRVSAGSAMRSELALGDLDSSRVKEWAIAESTRIGPVVQLLAPNYGDATERPAPVAVYQTGFSKKRAPLPSHRFSGRPLTRLAFARFELKR